MTVKHNDPPLFQETTKHNTRDYPREDAPLARVDPQPLATVPASAESDVTTLIRMALDKGQEPKELYAILKEERAARAQAALTAARAAFHAELTPIIRKQVSQFKKKIVTRDGATKEVPRMYADLSDIAAAIDPILVRHGLSYHWGETVVENNTLTKRCYLSHVGGGEISSPASFPVESNAGCSGAQKYGSAMTYAQRYSLVDVLGLTSCDEDDDGQDLQTGGGEALDENQRRTINDLFVELKLDDAGKAAFLAIFEVKSIAEIKQVMFGPVANALNARIKGLKR